MVKKEVFYPWIFNNPKDSAWTLGPSGQCTFLKNNSDSAKVSGNLTIYFSLLQLEWASAGAMQGVKVPWHSRARPWLAGIIISGILSHVDESKSRKCEISNLDRQLSLTVAASPRVPLDRSHSFRCDHSNGLRRRCSNYDSLCFALSVYLEYKCRALREFIYWSLHAYLNGHHKVSFENNRVIIISI